MRELPEGWRRYGIEVWRGGREFSFAVPAPDFMRYRCSFCESAFSGRQGLFQHRERRHPVYSAGGTQ